MRAHFSHDGRIVSYLDVTPDGSAPPERTLVLLHAFPLAAEMWRPQLEVVPAGWRFIAPDLCGFGQSQVGDPTLPATMEGYARDVVALLDRLRVDRVVIGGLSMRRRARAGTQWRTRSPGVAPPRCSTACCPVCSV
jgi:pimeloyl-ACP methyl ester carboxylesterase